MFAQGWGMIRTLCILPLLLGAACSTPSPRFIGTEAREVTVEGMRFRVYRRADQVEVHRTGGGLPKKSRVLLGAAETIERATGCPVRPRSMAGDQAIIVAEIDCGV